jgi:hypothetical protein
LKRFGLKEEADAALEKVRAAKISADNGTIRYTVDECRVTGRKVICTGEETYFWAGRIRDFDECLWGFAERQPWWSYQ